MRQHKSSRPDAYLKKLYYTYGFPDREEIGDAWDDSFLIEILDGVSIVTTSHSCNCLQGLTRRPALGMLPARCEYACSVLVEPCLYARRRQLITSVYANYNESLSPGWPNRE